MATNYTQIESSDWQALQDGMAEHDARLTAAATQHDALKKLVTDGQAAQDAKLASLDKDKVAHASRLTAVEASASAIDTRLKSVESWKLSANATMVRNEDMIEALQPQVAELDTRMDKAEPALKAVQDGQAAHLSRLNTIDTAIAGLKSNDGSLDSRLKAAEAFKVAMDTWKTAMDTWKSGFEAWKVEVEKKLAVPKDVEPAQ